MAEAGGFKKQLCSTSALIRTAPSANRVLAGIARSVAGAELTARACGCLSNEHGPAWAENVAAIRGVDYMMSQT
jgi:hypothetical protein